MQKYTLLQNWNTHKTNAILLLLLLFYLVIKCNAMDFYQIGERLKNTHTVWNLSRFFEFVMHLQISTLNLRMMNLNDFNKICYSVRYKIHFDIKIYFILGVNWTTNFYQIYSLE